ncbi:hypothetical protein NDU88_006006 [Pleurodeles waltl]|uniref:L1 transposable element RRM domain-containing protein n=1 Tax=Pleurodeles waltl TaxID=8319 RepID=A0AAV7NP07_PLEWA|nr:hypothetical protein NDU88_006006 [Pleurodeles waltl]
MEGAQPSVIMAMEKVGAEVRVEETVVLDKGEKIKDQCPVSAVNSESQEEQSGETPPVTMLLEETVQSLKEDVVQIKQDLEESRACEQDLQDKLEQLENAARKNNLRILNIPEGVEGNDIKSHISPHKNTLQLEESEQDIAADIQRIHRDPIRRDHGRKKPQKVLINFFTYALNEKILLKALKQKTLRGNDFSFEVRSDLARSTLNKQWELGNRLEDFKKLGASAQLKFPATLRVIHNNKMYNLRDTKTADDLLDTIRNGPS